MLIHLCSAAEALGGDGWNAVAPRLGIGGLPVASLGALCLREGGGGRHLAVMLVQMQFCLLSGKGLEGVLRLEIGGGECVQCEVHKSHDPPLARGRGGYWSGSRGWGAKLVDGADPKFYSKKYKTNSSRN
jgi:hypothetical protein